MTAFNDSQWPLLYVKVGSEPLTNASFRDLLENCSQYSERNEWYRLLLDLTTIPKVPVTFIAKNLTSIAETQAKSAYLDSVMLIVPPRLYKLCSTALKIIPQRIPLIVVKDKESAKKQTDFLNLQSLHARNNQVSVAVPHA